MLTTQQLHFAIFIVVVLFSTFTFAQFDYGALLATDSYSADLVVFNATSVASFQTICSHIFGKEIYTPAYVTNTATRELYYLKSSSFESRRDDLYQASFSYNPEENTFECGSEMLLCNSTTWRTNDTMGIFVDPTMGVILMVDTFYYATYLNEIRVWRIGEDCSLTLADFFVASALDVDQSLTMMYDQSNHIMYIVYSGITVDEFRLRSYNIQNNNLNYDMNLPFATLPNVTYAQFSPSTGHIYFLSGDDTKEKANLLSYEFNPITLNFNVLPFPKIQGDKAGPYSNSLIVSWRAKLVSLIRDNLFTQDNSTISTFNSDGTFNSSFVLSHYFDNGLFYDPLIQITPVNINTASEEELLNGLPSITSQIAQEIVTVRNMFGSYHNVDSLLWRVVNLPVEMFQNFRPWAVV